MFFISHLGLFCNPVTVCPFAVTSQKKCEKSFWECIHVLLKFERKIALWRKTANGCAQWKMANSCAQWKIQPNLKIKGM